MGTWVVTHNQGCEQGFLMYVSFSFYLFFLSSPDLPTQRKRSVRAGLTPRRQASPHTSFSGAAAGGAQVRERQNEYI
jgi:hypothetical protein